MHCNRKTFGFLGLTWTVSSYIIILMKKFIIIAFILILTVVNSFK